jgi:hypothetical protein
VTYPQRRLAELDALSRQRPLTDAEQREAMLRARQDRRNRARKRQYWLDPDYRARQVARAKVYREARA